MTQEVIERCIKSRDGSSNPRDYGVLGFSSSQWGELDLFLFFRLPTSISPDTFIEAAWDREFSSSCCFFLLSERWAICQESAIWRVIAQLRQSARLWKRAEKCRWQLLLTLEEQLYMFIPFNQFHMAEKLAGEFVSCIVLLLDIRIKQVQKLQ